MPTVEELDKEIRLITLKHREAMARKLAQLKEYLASEELELSACSCCEGVHVHSTVKGCLVHIENAFDGDLFCSRKGVVIHEAEEDSETILFADL